MRYLTRLVIAATLLVASTLNAADRPLNFVIIFTDDQGYADVGCFGAEDLATPNRYNLSHDPGESHNVAEQHLELVRELTELVNQESSSAPQNEVK